MIVYDITRFRSDFPAYNYNVTSSYNDIEDHAILHGNYSMAVSHAGGVSVTREGRTDIFVSNYASASHISAAGGQTVYHATSSENATMSSYSVSSSFSNSASNADAVGTASSTSTSSSTSDTFVGTTSYTASITDVIGSTTSTSYNSYRYTSTNITTSESIYTVISGALATTHHTRNIVTVGSETTTVSAVAYTFDTSEFDTYIQHGVHVVADDTDWLWFLSVSDESPNLVSDIAFTASFSSYWPEAVEVPLSFATAADTSASSNTYLIVGDAVTYSPTDIYSTDTLTTTVTKGIYFSRDTTTSSAPHWETSSDTFSVGFNDATITTNSTMSYSFFTTSYDWEDSTLTYPYGYSNASTTSFAVLTSMLTTSSYVSDMPALLVAGSTATASHTAIFGATIEETTILYKNISVVPFGAGPSAITPVAQHGAFIAGADLKSAGSPYHFGTNLSFNGGHIPYPNSAVASVLSNVQTPIGLTASTTGSNHHTYSYKWNGETVQETEISTYTVGTKTSTNSTVTSGTFGTFGATSHFFTMRNSNVFGGFGRIETAEDSVTFPPRAVVGTFVSTDGSSNTYRTLQSYSFSFPLSETVVVEETIPAYRVITFLGAENAGDPLYLGFARN